MGDFVRITEVAALQELRGGLLVFAEHAAAALCEAEGDIRGTIRWLEQQQLAYWQGQLVKRQEACTAAKQALQFKKAMEKNPLGIKYSYVDEKKALALAQRRLEEAQTKLAHVKRWIGVLEKAAFEYQSAVQGLLGMLETQIPNACAQLDAMTAALEGYLAARGSVGAPAPAAPPESVRRTVAETPQTPPESPEKKTAGQEENEQL